MGREIGKPKDELPHGQRVDRAYVGIGECELEGVMVPVIGMVLTFVSPDHEHQTSLFTVEAAEAFAYSLLECVREFRGETN